MNFLLLLFLLLYNAHFRMLCLILFLSCRIDFILVCMADASILFSTVGRFEVFPKSRTLFIWTKTLLNNVRIKPRFGSLLSSDPVECCSGLPVNVSLLRVIRILRAFRLVNRFAHFRVWWLIDNQKDQIYPLWVCHVLMNSRRSFARHHLVAQDVALHESAMSFHWVTCIVRSGSVFKNYNSTCTIDAGLSLIGGGLTDRMHICSCCCFRSMFYPSNVIEKSNR